MWPLGGLLEVVDRLGTLIFWDICHAGSQGFLQFLSCIHTRQNDAYQTFRKALIVE